MKTFLLNLGLKLLTSNTTKTLIGLGVNKLLEHKTDGITKDLAKTLIDGVVQSKANPVEKFNVYDALDILK